MPTYLPLSTTVQLYVCPLAQTTTANPKRRKAAFSSSEAAKAENNIKSGRALKETPVACDGENSRLHFLGLNKEVPFYLMHVGNEIFGKEQLEKIAGQAQAAFQDGNAVYGRVEKETGRTVHKQSAKLIRSRSTSSSSARSLKHPDKPRLSLEQSHLSFQERPAKKAVNSKEAETLLTGLSRCRPPAQRSRPKTSKQVQKLISPGDELAPQAIGLLLTTSKSTYLPAFDQKQTAQDLKIDVFYNGELTECIFIPARLGYRDFGTRGKEAMVQLISGRRMDALIERPWVIVPPQQNADGSLRSTSHTQASRSAAKGRWEDIGKAIMYEAELQGFNNYGDCTPTGSYLASLAALEMPEAVGLMQKSDGPNFGVIDVVISAGVGKKGGPDTFYVKEPTRMVDENFQARIGGFHKAEDKAPVTCTAFANPSINTSIAGVSSPRDGTSPVEISKTQRTLIQSSGRYTGKLSMVGPGKRADRLHTNITTAHVEGEDTVMQDVDMVFEGDGAKAEKAVRDENLVATNPERHPENTITEVAPLPEVEIASKDVRISDNVNSANGVGEAFVASMTGEDPVTQSDVIQESATDDRFSSFESHGVKGMSVISESTSGSSVGSNDMPRHSRTSLSFDSTASPLSAFPSFETVTQTDSSFDSALSQNVMSTTLPKYELGSLDIVTPTSQQVENGKSRTLTHMPPPKTPSVAPVKRRQSDTILLADAAPSPKRRRDSVANNTVSSDQTGGSELIITRRGAFDRQNRPKNPSKRDPTLEIRETKLSVPTPPSREAKIRISRSKTAAMIRRILIEFRGVVIVEKVLDPPLPLQRPDRSSTGHMPISPLFPLHESIVFSLKDMTKPPPTPLLPPPKLNPKVTPRQIQTPFPSSSPTRVPQSSPSRKPPAAPCIPVSDPYPALDSTPRPGRVAPPRPTLAAAARRRDKEPQSYAKELKDAWRTPELSKDCVLSYAEEGAWVNEHGGGVLRHIKSARPGRFVESEVLFAVRYLVG